MENRVLRVPAKKKEKKEKGQEPPLDELLENLEGIVQAMEEGNLSLDKTLAKYEEGVAVARKAHSLLDAAEKKIEVLSASGELSPLDDGSAEE